MATVNAINNKSQDLTIDPGASGDSFVQFDINGTGEFRIGVDDTDDSFRIAQGSALGTTDVIISSAAGEVTKPLQPSFLTHRNADLTDVTGDGTLYTIVWDSEEFDRGGDFDGTSTFTAPATGIYYFVVSILLDNLAAAWTRSYFNIVSTGDTYRGGQLNPGAMQTSGDLTLLLSAVVPMTAADTVTTQVYVFGSTKTIDIQGNTSAGVAANYFAGYLMA